MDTIFIHPSADVQTKTIGKGTKIWQNVVILPDASLGNEGNICAHCFIENNVSLGDRVTVKCGVSLWNGLTVEDDVFIGPNVSFVNDKYPRSKKYPKQFLQTHIEAGASIGAGAVILGGITIGQKAMVGAGAVVTKSVPPYAIVRGNPAQIEGYVESEITISTPSALLSLNEDTNKILVGVGDAFLCRLKTCKDLRGDLAVGDFEKDIPFTPKRYFLVSDVPSDKVRGEHAHYTCNEFAICVRGSCMIMLDNGTTRREVSLSSPDTGVLLPAMVWRALYKFTQDAVLLVFASDYYDPADYIREYSKYLAVLKRQ